MLLKKREDKDKSSNNSDNNDNGQIENDLEVSIKSLVINLERSIAEGWVD